MNLFPRISYIDVGKISSSFSIKNHCRDIKLNEILDADISFNKMYIYLIQNGLGNQIAFLKQEEF
jgi:hypothetical protein